MWCRYIFQVQQLHIGQQRFIGYLSRVANFPTIGITFLKPDYENYEFRWHDDGLTRIVEWKRI